EQEESLVRGEVKSVTFRNSENGFSVFQVSTPEQQEQITVVGECAHTEIHVGVTVLARGSYMMHPKFGRQLKAHSITVTPPATPQGIRKYLASGIIKGIGEKTAKRIVEKFGQKTLEVIHQHPEKVAKIAGVGRHRAEILANVLRGHKEIDTIVRFLV